MITPTSGNGDARQFANLADLRRAHLEHGEIVFVVHFEDRKGQSDVIVEVFLAAAAVKARREDGIDHFTRRRLADASP